MAAKVARLLRQVRARKVTPEAALERLAHLPSEDAGFARLDHHRALRLGVPEAIYCPGKSRQQVSALMARLVAGGSPALATRMPPEWSSALLEEFRTGTWHETAALFEVRPRGRRRPGRGRPQLAVVAAGTADLRTAEEAAVTAEAVGIRTDRLYDVGVAGLHRLLAEAARLRAVRAVICVAGMDGALPSVLGGLVRAPVIAVPTSAGYGASFGGLAALLTMLNSCAPGVVTVNIDNGYGAAVAACKMLRAR